jgi:hypothetical protein
VLLIGVMTTTLRTMAGPRAQQAKEAKEIGRAE